MMGKGAMRAEILSIGDEVIRGEITNTNASRLAEALLLVEIETVCHTVVRDVEEEISGALALAADRADVVLVTGGLGPTRDDVTTAAAAALFGRELRLDEESLEKIRSFFKLIGREMTENNRKQAFFPEGAEILANPIGTAPGFSIEEGDVVFFFMPGVPRELDLMMENEVIPRLRARRKARGLASAVRVRLIRAFGMGEAQLDAHIAGVAGGVPGVTIGFRTVFPDILVRILAVGKDEAEASSRLEKASELMRKRLGPLTLSESGETMEEVVGDLLRGQGKTLAVAESCTGGLIASRVTDVPGSSDYFRRSVVAYADDAKTDLLGVPPEMLAEKGAVSAEVAGALARGIRERSGTDIGIGVTGIAGPAGGSEEKPVGLVYIAIAHAGGTDARRFQLFGDRGRVKRLGSQIALELVRRHLLGIDPAAGAG